MKFKELNIFSIINVELLFSFSFSNPQKIFASNKVILFIGCASALSI
ncbi:MAG: hypothetical protein LBI11_00935 [Streptococcaceae bacterium]|jgi:hypothetical protein|nr:hypothetical protein [Streptococcaceae bacterium]